MIPEQYDNKTENPLSRFPLLVDMISFFSNESPLGIIGSTILDVLGYRNDFLIYKHKHIHQGLDASVLFDLLTYIKEKKLIEIVVRHDHDTETDLLINLIPKSIESSIIDGFQYLLADDVAAESSHTYRIRIDHIDNIIPSEAIDVSQIQNTATLDNPIEKNLSCSKRVYTVDFSIKYDVRYEGYISKRIHREFGESDITDEHNGIATLRVCTTDLFGLRRHLLSFCKRVCNISAIDDQGSEYKEFADSYKNEIREMIKLYSHHAIDNDADELLQSNHFNSIPPMKKADENQGRAGLLDYLDSSRLLDATSLNNLWFSTIVRIFTNNFITCDRKQGNDVYPEKIAPVDALFLGCSNMELCAIAYMFIPRKCTNNDPRKLATINYVRNWLQAGNSDNRNARDYGRNKLEELALAGLCLLEGEKESRKFDVPMYSNNSGNSEIKKCSALLGFSSLCDQLKELICNTLELKEYDDEFFCKYVEKVLLIEKVEKDGCQSYLHLVLRDGNTKKIKWKFYSKQFQLPFCEEIPHNILVDNYRDAYNDRIFDVPMYSNNSGDSIIKKCSAVLGYSKLCNQLKQLVCKALELKEYDDEFFCKYVERVLLIEEPENDECPSFLHLVLRKGDTVIYKWKFYRSRLPYINYRPFTQLEAQWLYTICQDTKAKLFLNEDSLSSIMNFLENNVLDCDQNNLLYDKSNYNLIDQYSDGDNYNELYQSIFQRLISAIKEKERIKIFFVPQNQSIMANNIAFESKPRECTPIKLEYSSLDNKFRVYVYAHDDKRHFQQILLSNIKKIEQVLDEKEDSDQKDWEDFKQQFVDSQQTATIKVFPYKGLIDDFFASFSLYKKKTSYDSKTNTCIVTIYYRKDDNIEIIMRLLRYGRCVEVLSSNDLYSNTDSRYKTGLGIREEIISRLNEQAKLLGIQGVN